MPVWVTTSGTADLTHVPPHLRTCVRLCGTFAVEIAGHRVEGALRGRQARLLFAYLVVNRERPVRRDELIDALWPETPPAAPDDALNTLLSRLRKALGPGVVGGRSELTLKLAADARVDVEAAFDELGQAERGLEHADWEQAGDAAGRAASLVEQGFLVGVQAPWVDDHRARIEELHLRALECLAACGLRRGGVHLSAAEDAARTLIAASPYRETGYCYLMQALAERGRVAEALQAFEDVRRLLSAELGVPPGAELRALHERLVTHRGRTPRAERDDPPAVDSSTVLLCAALDACTDAADVAQQLLQTHARLLRRAVAIHGGSMVTQRDVGSTAIFADARTAIDCAVQVQQGAELHDRRRRDRRLRARAAIHCGDADASSGELAEVARQLCLEHAGPGQILVTAPVRSRAPAERRFDTRADLDLRAGETSELRWEPVRQQPMALPAALPPGERDLFVGRDADLRVLWSHFEETCAGAPRIVLIAGEPGVGKTRLAVELALRAHADGAAFLFGRCDEDPLLPHQPFVEALRHYVAECPLTDLARQVGLTSGELRRLVPEIADRLPHLAQQLAGDPAGERYRLFEAVSALLCDAADARPVVLVLDDLHWADKPTLLLLRHLTRQWGDAPLLVVGTYREAELHSGHALTEAMADLSRRRALERLSLGSLDEAAVLRLVTSHAGSDAPQLSRMVFEQTAGNALFVVEMLRHLAESGTARVGVPERVKDVIGHRIARLEPQTRRMLRAGAVCGREFELVVLEQMRDLEQDELVDAIEHALRAQIIEEVGGCAGRYTFSHALTRDAIYGSMSATRRALLHRRVAAALEQEYAAELEPHFAELASHFAQAGLAGDLEKAIEYGARAGDRAVAQLAYEQAAVCYRDAASLIESIARVRLLRRCDLVIAQGEAECRAGDPAHRETLLAGARLAQELGDPARMARAALANNRGYFSAATGVDHERVAVLRDALEAYGADDSTTRATLLAHLAVELVADPDASQRARISDEALAMARRVGDPRTLLRTLNYRFVTLWGPHTVSERMANAREAHRLAEELQDPVLAFHAATHAAHAAMEAGEPQLADQLLVRAGQLAEQLRQPTIQWYFAVGRAKRMIFSGSLDEAEQLSYEGRRLGRSAGQPDAEAWSIGQLFVIRFLQGALGGERPNFLAAAEAGIRRDSAHIFTGSRSVPLLSEAMSIVTFCEVGRTDDARVRFDEFVRDDLIDVPQDWAALAIPALASVACSHLRDSRRAQQLYAMLEPHQGQLVDSGPFWLGTATHYLALLAATLGRLDEADARFSDAADTYAAFAAEAWLRRVALDRARIRQLAGMAR